MDGGDQQDEGRRELLRRGRWVEIASLTYNAIEVGVSLVAGFIAGSSALIAFGLDSVVEGLSGGMLLWRLRGEEQGVGKAEVKRRKRRALYVLAFSFFALSAFILYDATSKLAAQETPETSIVGIALLFVSLVLNPFLAWGKYATGKKLGSEALVLDAKDTMICLYQTIVVLAGLGLNAALGWWWADPVAALAIIPYALWEGREAVTDARAAKQKNAW